MFLHVYEQKKAKRYQLLESKTIMKNVQLMP